MAAPKFPSIADRLSPASPLSHSSHPSDVVEPFSEWPKLDGIENVDIDNEPPADWIQRPCPPELHGFPESTPKELIRILKLSVNVDLYKNQDDEKEFVAPAPPESLQSPVEAPRINSTDTPRSEVASLITRSSSSISQWSSTLSKAGSSTKSTLGRLSVKAPKEARAIKSSMIWKYTVQECASCLEGITEKNLLRMECQHRYCLKCFVTLITTAMHNENQFPPKCCLVEIPVKVILHNLDNANRDLYHQKVLEYSLPQQSRWYCPSPSCGKWISPKKIKDSAPIQKCPSCKDKFCGFCRGPLHEDGVDCPKDLGLEATLEEAEMHGWRRCYQCRAMVELVSGCNHMTCKCSAQFCYTCGAPWRTCQCTDDDQRRREEQLQAQRLKRNETTEIDAGELAKRLADIKRLEQLETEERIRQEKQEAEERARQQEEQRRREEEEARERETQRMLLITETIRKLRLALARINKSQQTMLTMRHYINAGSLQSKLQDEEKRFGKTQQQLQTALQANVKKRTDALVSAQEAQMQELISKQEDEEDETFISMSRHLKNKPNREEREKSILDKLKASQARELASLQESHREAMEELEFKSSIELKSLEVGLTKYAQEACPSVRRYFEYIREIMIDRQWFHVVTKKRSDLLELHRMRLIRGEIPVEKIVEKHRPKHLYFTKFPGPPSPPPTYPLPSPPTMRLPPTPASSLTPSSASFPRPPESPRPSPTPTAAPAVVRALVPKREQIPLKKLIVANSRNRRVNRSAFAVLHG
ncbi:hypothetical protein PRK78_004854 [Emydomyces testavorans]|uniref:RBR-type E3 ubiquitin transferase n=1 Tax=Emydomyces testavorans TaxID=2070801 RepID=A0AAF0IJK0_9EURO|nr:hypothetical protein PRK78_004854 [Emydomyces testavorans]